MHIYSIYTYTIVQIVQRELGVGGKANKVVANGNYSIALQKVVDI